MEESNNVEVLQTTKDLLLAHLLRIARDSRELVDSLPVITSELQNLGIISEDVQNMAIQPSSSFDASFHLVFGDHITSSQVPAFWKTTSDSGHSRDFEKIKTLGRGGFGEVSLCKNKLDERQYAVKKIEVMDTTLPAKTRVLREVTALSLLQHKHVVRYYQAWFGKGDIEKVGSTSSGESGTISEENYPEGNASSHENGLDPTFLYIQMEYCPRTLKQTLKVNEYRLDDETIAWDIFRQIVKGLKHIHAKGIIHRDLTPNNIFFDARNDIKIGDFGLAKFRTLEQIDQDIAGVSMDGTTQAGSHFYTAPEIEQRQPNINEKADIYSLGIVFFELFHPFGTVMERHKVLTNLKQKGLLPSSWATNHPRQAHLLKCFISSTPSQRPSAKTILEELPHYMYDTGLFMPDRNN